MEEREEELQIQKVKWAEGMKPTVPLIFSTVETSNALKIQRLTSHLSVLIFPTK